MKTIILLLIILACALGIYLILQEIKDAKMRKNLESLLNEREEMFGKDRKPIDHQKAREADIAYISSWRLVYDERTGRYVKMREANVQKNRPR